MDSYDAYQAITDVTEDQRWAFGTGFDDPLSGVDTTIPDGVSGADLGAYCEMLGDDALIMSHRLQQWVAHAPGAGGGSRAGQYRARPARPGSSPSGPRRRGRRIRAHRRRLRVPAAGRHNSGNVRLVETRRRRFRRRDGAAARVQHLAAGPAGSATGIPRPGAGRHRRQGRERDDLPPRLRRPVGDPPG